MTNSLVPPRDFRDRVREEAAHLGRVAAKELKKPPQSRRQHIIDGCEVAAQSLRKLAAEWATEARTEELLEATAGGGEPDDD